MTSYWLVAFGFGWMVVAAVIGLVIGAKHESYLDQLKTAAANGDLATYHQVFEAYKWNSTVHAHGMLFSLSSIAVGAVLSSPAGSGVSGPVAIIAALMVATVTWTLAAAMRLRPLMGLADLMFLGAMAVVAAGVAVKL